MRPGSASMLASMTGAMRLSAGNNYASVGNEANGGSGSIYDHFEASGMGNGDNHGDHDHVNGNFSGDGFDNHEVGRDGDGEGDGDGDEEERQRQKKLSLACHFCRRRKLK